MKIFRVFIVLVAMVLSFSPSAFANLLISPLQVVMEGRDRSAHITLVNNGSETNTYRILWEQFVQVDKLGGYAPYFEAEKYNVVEPEGARHLKDFAVFSPRQITLAPGEKQTVRIAVRRPKDLALGEHKSHLKFQVLPKTSPNDVRQSDELKQSEVKFGARVNASFSIPVIYRVGDYDVDVAIQTPRFTVNESTGKLIVHVPLTRSGLHGAIGEVSVYYTPNGGAESLIGSLGNANLFPELTSREVSVPTRLSGLNPGSIRIVYQKAEGQKADYETLAELVVPVSN